jgi:4-amino-4-deoxy-L-arabinose transferase-like glycosyltransferase
MAAAVELFGRPVCLMIMSYIGALKAWLYAPLFALWPPSVWSLRSPMVAAGAVTVVLFAALLGRVAGRRAAIIGAVLLASDPIFLATATFDWGPVALQQLLLVGALLLLACSRLTSGAVALGLALWNKAIFAWVLIGVALAAVAVYGRRIRAELDGERLLRACGGFFLGALPLLIYNVHHPGEAVRGRRFSLREMAPKIEVMKRTVRGDAMAGFLVSGEAYGEERPAATPIERASLWLSNRTGRRITGWQLYLIPLAAAGLLRRRARRLLLFFALAFLIAWAEMLVISEAGGGVHHTITLWPLLAAFLAIGLAAAFPAGRAGALGCGLVCALAAGSNVAVANEHLARLIRFGPQPLWTDAVFPLAEEIRAAGVRYVHPADWGIGDVVKLLTAGAVVVEEAVQPVMRQELDEDERRRLLERVARPGALFAGHVEGRRYFPRANDLLDQAAREAGFTRQRIGLVEDSRGRPVFELFRFVSAR